MTKHHSKKHSARAAALTARERVLEGRRALLEAHDATATKRDADIAQREELLRLREAELEARREIDFARAERERLLVEIREANEKLVLASLHCMQLADDANVARASADDVAERFRALVLASSSLVWRAGADGRIVVDDAAWRRFTGKTPGPGEWGWLEAVHALDRARVRKMWKEAVAGRRPYACQHRLRVRHRNYAWVMSRAVPIIKGDTVREWIGMMSDVSDRVRVEEAREQFIGILGHDLRNPLASIIAGLDVLRDLPEPYTRTVARLRRSAYRIDSMVHDLLDFARGRLGGGIPVTPRDCDMGAICECVVEEIRSVHPTRQVIYEHEGDLSGTWDPDRIEQVISNLLGNAVVHGADPIVVTSRPADDHVIMAVHNEGPPIADAVIPTLFEPFTSGEQAELGREFYVHRGLGLGLYIANEIAQSHGGTLSVDSAPGKGTTFTLSVPRHTPPRATPKDEHPAMLSE